MFVSTGGRRKELQLLSHGEEEEHSGRFLSKDSSLQNPSFRVYYSVTTGAVPFQWEVRPGTPKRTSDSDGDGDGDGGGGGGGLPTVFHPLTPPPSHLLHPTANHRRRAAIFKSSSFTSFLSRLRKPKSWSRTPTSPSTLTSSPSFSSSSSFSTPARRRFLRWRSAVSSRSALSLSSADDVEPDGDDNRQSPKSVMCFKVGSARVSFSKANPKSTTIDANTI